MEDNFLVEVYSKKEYSINKTSNGYIVVNNEMPDFAHTHIRNIQSAKWMIELSLSKKCPYDMKDYFVHSLIRINDDELFLNKLNAILLKKKKKKDYYFNPQKKCGKGGIC